MPAATGTPQTDGDFPSGFYATIRIIDRFTDVSGRLLAMSMLILMFIITYEVVMRYAFNAPTVWVYEASSMINGSAFMIGCAYALFKGAHVRTDIYWEKFSERKKGYIDLASYLLLFFPTMITLFVISVDDAWYSYTIQERSQESIWRAIVWPFRSAIPLAALVFAIQGISETLKCWYQIRFGREFQHREKFEV